MFARFSLGTLASALLGLGGSKYAMGVYVTVSVFLHVLAVTDWRSVVAGMGSTPPDSDKQKKMDGYSYLI